MKAAATELASVPIGELKPYENNPRNNAHAVDAVAESIKRFGFRSPIVAQSDGTIINGHTRYRAAVRLGLAEVPVIYADDLTEDEARAYRIADNKVGELATWNETLLKVETTHLAELDMDLAPLSIDLPTLDETPVVEDDLEPSGYYGRAEGLKAYNLHLLAELPEWDASEYPTCGMEGVPAPDDLIAYHALNEKGFRGWRQGVHCFVDDYRIERLWKQPERYVDQLKPLAAVCTPDFSLYIDMPDPVTRWNVYRNRMLGAWWEAQGVTVVPSVSWGEANTLPYAFAGIREGATVAISTMSMTRDPALREAWQRGYDALLEDVRPGLILAYDSPERDGIDFRGANVRHYSNDRLAVHRKGKTK